MDRILWLIGGAAVGFVIAHQLGKTDQGKQFFRTLDERTTEFSKAVTDQYKAREADLKAAIANVEEAITEFSAKAR